MKPGLMDPHLNAEDLASSAWKLGPLVRQSEGVDDLRGKRCEVEVNDVREGEDGVVVSWGVEEGVV